MAGNISDKVYTPDDVAEDIVRFFAPTGSILEPCKGGGAFLKHLPTDTLWCEIDEGVDFFDFDQKVEWIVTNPPYSTFDKWLTRSLEIASDIVFLIPVPKLMASYNKMNEVYEWGGIAHIRYYASGRKMGFPFGFPVAAFHLKKGYTGSIETTFFNKSLVKF